MRSFHLMLIGPGSSEPRRIDFQAEGPDHAFQIARNESAGVHAELWEGGTLLARMAKSTPDMWKLLPSASPEQAASGAAAS